MEFLAATAYNGIVSKDFGKRGILCAPEGGAQKGR
jgi:hypothetical protein